MLIDETIYEVAVRDRHVCFELGDGRHVHVALDWLPKLEAVGRTRCGEPEIAEDGRSVTWPAIGETISIERVLTRRR